MRRIFVVIALVLGVLAACEPTPAGYQRVECVQGANNGPAIQAALDNTANSQVHLAGVCTLAWRVRTGDARYRVGFQIPNNHTVLISGAVVLLPGQPACLDPNDGLPSGSYCDIISNAPGPVTGIVLRGSTNVGGIVDGLSGDQPGNGFDGIHIFNCTNCLIEDLTARNIRGLDTAGGRTETGAIVYQNCQGNCVMRRVHATSSSTHHRDWTSSGLGANSSTGVDIIDSKATEIRGRGIAVWNAHDLYIEDGFVHNVDAHSYGFEYSNTVTIDGAWGSGSNRGALVIHDTSGVVATGLILNPQRAAKTITLRNEVENPLPCGYNSLSGEAWAGTAGPIAGRYETHGDDGCQVVDNLVWH
jgi:hypothetical protein